MVSLPHGYDEPNVADLTTDTANVHPDYGMPILTGVPHGTLTEDGDPMTYDNLFQPLAIGGVTIPNRIARTAHSTGTMGRGPHRLPRGAGQRQRTG